MGGLFEPLKKPVQEVQEYLRLLGQVGRGVITRPIYGRDMIEQCDAIGIGSLMVVLLLVSWHFGLIEPHRDETGYLFDRLDQARIALACDLHYRMGLESASLPFILSLVDQLHDTRHLLKAMARAIAEQPDVVQRKISDHIARSRGANAE